MLVDRWTIGQRLYGGLAAFLALIVLAGGVATWSSSRIRNDVDTIAQRATELQRALGIQTALFKIESSEKTLLWAGLDNDRPLYDASKAAVATEYEGMSKLVAALEAALVVQADLTAVRTIRQNLTEWKTIHVQVVTLSDSGSFAGAQQLLTLTATPLLKAAEEAAQSIVGRHEAAMTEANEEAAASYRYSQLFTGLVIMLALLVGGLGAWLARALNTSLRNVSRELAEGAELVVDTSSQMSVSAESMAQGASEQAASLEETSASMEEMASMTRRNADDSHQAATLMGEAARVVDSSNDVLTGMVTSMTSIQDSSKRVSKIIKTIDEIAFQTNILALNAAVEAARAGEAGMGFAVVADEVRNLAQRSAQAAKDTAGLIEEAITSSSEGSQKVEQVAGAFRAITQRVSEVKSLVDNVSVASKQQALGIEQVSQSIRQMEKVTQTTAATAEESAAACEQLNAQADITMRLVERLEGMVGRNNAREPRARAAAAPASRGRRSKVATLLPLAGAARHHASDEDVALAESGTFARF